MGTTLVGLLLDIFIIIGEVTNHYFLGGVFPRAADLRLGLAAWRIDIAFLVDLVLDH